MVNVGGRSKGCSTCRRRRVKCDETRPICRRCQRCGFECTGARDITFVEGTIVKSRRNDKRAPVPTEYGASSTDGQLAPSISLKGSDFEIYICFAWKKYLRRGGILDLVLQDTRLDDIIAAGSSKDNGQTFHRAVLSFAALVFGTQHGQAGIVNQGYVIHGKALKQLNQALSDPKCYTHDDIILSVIALALLECLAPTVPKQYLNHMIGLERLLELRGPDSHCSPKSSALYKSVRHMILFASLRMRKSSMLARAEWKAALRAHCSDEEMQEQDLFDVLADCTALVAEHDNVLANAELQPEKGAAHQRGEIERRAPALLTQLRAWRGRWGGRVGNYYSESSEPLTELQPMSESREDDSLPFLTAFGFSNESAAIMLMFYNTTLIYVLRLLASLHLQEPGTSFEQSSMQNTIPEDDSRQHTNDKYTIAERSAASEICRCIPYYLVQESRLDLEPSPIVHWAATTAWMTLRSHKSPAGRWIMDLLNTQNRGVIAQALWAS